MGIFSKDRNNRKKPLIDVIDLLIIRKAAPGNYQVSKILSDTGINGSSRAKHLHKLSEYGFIQIKRTGEKMRNKVISLTSKGNMILKAFEDYNGD